MKFLIILVMSLGVMTTGHSADHLRLAFEDEALLKDYEKSYDSKELTAFITDQIAEKLPGVIGGVVVSSYEQYFVDPLASPEELEVEHKISFYTFNPTTDDQGPTEEITFIISDALISNPRARQYNYRLKEMSIDFLEQLDQVNRISRRPAIVGEAEISQETAISEIPRIEGIDHALSFGRRGAKSTAVNNKDFGQ